MQSQSNNDIAILTLDLSKGVAVAPLARSYVLGGSSITMTELLALAADVVGHPVTVDRQPDQPERQESHRRGNQMDLMLGSFHASNPPRSAIVSMARTCP